MTMLLKSIPYFFDDLDQTQPRSTHETFGRNRRTSPVARIPVLGEDSASLRSDFGRAMIYRNAHFFAPAMIQPVCTATMEKAMKSKLAYAVSAVVLLLAAPALAQEAAIDDAELRADAQLLF
jgi:hypothetical protein